MKAIEYKGQKVITTAMLTEATIFGFINAYLILFGMPEEFKVFVKSV